MFHWGEFNRSPLNFILLWVNLNLCLKAYLVALEVV